MGTPVKDPSITGGIPARPDIDEPDMGTDFDESEFKLTDVLNPDISRPSDKLDPVKTEESHVLNPEQTLFDDGCNVCRLKCTATTHGDRDIADNEMNLASSRPERKVNQ